METLFIGKNTIFLPETESTNSYAIGLLKNVNQPEGTVVWTTAQTRGRGQRGNAWIAEPHCNLAASFILKPEFLPLRNQFFLYQIAALACHDTLSGILDNRQFDIKIKWPNDLLVNGKKIAGILIENHLSGETIRWSVAGIGINLNQWDFGDLPSATSLIRLMNEAADPEHVLRRLSSSLEKFYRMLRAGRENELRQLYLAHLFGWQSWMNFSIKDRVQKLYVDGISATGLLCLKDEAGTGFEADVKQLRWEY